MTLDIMPHEIFRGIERLKPMKMKIVNKNGLIIINDIFNTNPSSIHTALEVLCSSGSRRVCILGDMPELGEDSDSALYDLGLYASGRDIDTIIVIGERARSIYKGAASNKKSYADLEYFPTIDLFMEDMNSLIYHGDTVLVKASCGMGFEDIIEKLTR